MKTARKIIFIILTLLPILPLICQVVSNIGNDTAQNLYSWGGEYEGQISTPYIEIEISEVEYNGEILEFISIDPSYLDNEGISDKFLWGIYSGNQISTKTFMGVILKTTYNLISMLGFENSPVIIYSVMYITYITFIEIVMLFIDLTMLIPRKIKEWLN